MQIRCSDAWVPAARPLLELWEWLVFLRRGGWGLPVRDEGFFQRSAGSSFVEQIFQTGLG